MKFSRRLHRVTSRALLLACFLCAGNASLSQEDASEPLAAAELDRFIADVDDLSARFVETIYDADGTLGETSEGRFLLLRPDRFIWHYETPFDYQVIGDGKTLWTYDVELEQITRRPLSDLEATPATLLSGESGVGDRYEVSAARPEDVVTELSDDARWIELRPAERQGDFLEARIAFRDGVPVALELVDGLGQLTTVEFSEVVINSDIDPATFDFVPPPDVNVAGDG